MMVYITSCICKMSGTDLLEKSRWIVKSSMKNDKQKYIELSEIISAIAFMGDRTRFEVRK